MESKDCPVFPIGGHGALHTGMSKREYFAAMAMQGILANSYQSDYLNQKPLSLASCIEVAELATNQADALLNALNNPR